MPKRTLTWATKLNCEECRAKRTVIVVSLQKKVMKCTKCSAEYTLSAKKEVRPRFSANQKVMDFRA